jgi:hypothetical protein
LITRAIKATTSKDGILALDVDCGILTRAAEVDRDTTSTTTSSRCTNRAKNVISTVA